MTQQKETKASYEAQIDKLTADNNLAQGAFRVIRDRNDRLEEQVHKLIKIMYQEIVP